MSHPSYQFPHHSTQSEFLAMLRVACWEHSHTLSHPYVIQHDWCQCCQAEKHTTMQLHCNVCNSTFVHSLTVYCIFVFDWTLKTVMLDFMTILYHTKLIRYFDKICNIFASISITIGGMSNCRSMVKAEIIHPVIPILFLLRAIQVTCSIGKWHPAKPIK